MMGLQFLTVMLSERSLTSSRTSNVLHSSFACREPLASYVPSRLLWLCSLLLMMTGKERDWGDQGDVALQVFTLTVVMWKFYLNYTLQNWVNVSFQLHVLWGRDKKPNVIQVNEPVWCLFLSLCKFPLAGEPWASDLFSSVKASNVKKPIPVIIVWMCFFAGWLQHHVLGSEWGYIRLPSEWWVDNIFLYQSFLHEFVCMWVCIWHQ